ncbi:MAG: T9SS type A sorting domain-containing protein [Bacteroidota bacterium]|nr:T9SS type A sorting domain-containing protein [Bacteroidota bacterium]
MAHIQCYPNPFQDEINIVNTDVLNTNYNLDIIDLQGRILYTQKVSQALQTISTKHLSNGVYYIRLHNTEYNYTLKVIK